MRAAFLILLLVWTSACRDEPGPTFSVSVRDSAGVRIVEHRGAPPGAGDWALGLEPDLIIGRADGPAEHQLWEVAGAARLSDGRLAILNRGTLEIRVYAPDGSFLRAVGGRGEGPGEFSYMELAGVLPGDTLVVSDLDLRRLSLIHPDSGVERVVPISSEVTRWNWTLGLLDGLVLRGGIELYELSTLPEGQKEVERVSTSFQTVNLDGTLARDFGVFPFRDIFRDIGFINDHQTTVAYDVPFGAEASFAVGAGHFFFGEGDRFEIRVSNGRGDLQRLIRWERDPVQVTAGDLEGLRQERLGEAEDDDQAREIREEFRKVPPASHFPAFLGMEVDAAGFLWVREYPRIGDSTQTYRIFDPEGELSGILSLPSDLALLEIGEDYLLALFRDDLDLEYVRRYRLERP